jgi:hypothetical protein
VNWIAQSPASSLLRLRPRSNEAFPYLFHVEGLRREAHVSADITVRVP